MAAPLRVGPGRPVPGVQFSPINGESCTFDSLTPLESPGDPFTTTGPYRDLDGNLCGDASKSDGAIFKDFTLSNVLCQDQNNDGALDTVRTHLETDRRYLR